LKRSEMLSVPVGRALFQVTPKGLRSSSMFSLFKTETQEFLISGNTNWLDRIKGKGIRRANGQDRCVQSIRSSDRTAKGWMSVSITRDVAEQKRLKRQLANTKESYQQLFEHSGTSIIIVDERGRYLLTNEQAAADFNRTSDEVIGKSMFNVCVQERHART